MRIVNKNHVITKSSLSEGRVMTNNVVALSTQFSLFDQLIAIIGDLNGLIIAFQQDNYEYINANLTQPFFESISLKIAQAKSSQNKNVQYETFRKLINQTLYILYRAVEIRINAQTNDELLLLYKADSDTLRDSQLLQQYLESLNNIQSLFGEDLEMTSNITANVNPEYVEYIRLYGVPVNMVFVPEKLVEIKQRLGIA
jgi:hypothetical protein